jgi:hypothetical protein
VEKACKTYHPTFSGARDFVKNFTSACKRLRIALFPPEFPTPSFQGPETASI